MNKKGFTLIELLVVIAIIGILASIVLVSFPTANKKAMDSRIKSAISQGRTIMVSYGTNNGNYSGFTNASEGMGPLNTEVINNCKDGSAACATGITIVNSTDASSTCMWAPLNTKYQSSSAYYCADASGVSGTTILAPATNGCVAATAKCPALSGIE